MILAYFKYLSINSNIDTDKTVREIRVKDFKIKPNFFTEIPVLTNFGGPHFERLKTQWLGYRWLNSILSTHIQNCHEKGLISFFRVIPNLSVWLRKTK